MWLPAPVLISAGRRQLAGDPPLCRRLGRSLAERRQLTGKVGADYAFDCVGSARTIRDAWSMTRRGDSVCIVGVGPKDDVVSFNALELFHFARSLTGCVAGSLGARHDRPRFFSRIREGRLDLRQLVTGHSGLADIEPALDSIAAGRGIRTLVRPGPRD